MDIRTLYACEKHPSPASASSLDAVGACAFVGFDVGSGVITPTVATFVDSLRCEASDSCANASWSFVRLDYGTVSDCGSIDAASSLQFGLQLGMRQTDHRQLLLGTHGPRIAVSLQAVNASVYVGAGTMASGLVDRLNRDCPLGGRWKSGQWRQLQVAKPTFPDPNAVCMQAYTVEVAQRPKASVHCVAVLAALWHVSHHVYQ